MAARWRGMGGTSAAEQPEPARVEHRVTWAGVDLSSFPERRVGAASPSHLVEVSGSRSFQPIRSRVNSTPRSSAGCCAHGTSTVQLSVRREGVVALKDQRRELRLSRADEDLLVEAASLSGVSVSEFLLDRALPDAEQMVTGHRTITLNQDAYRRFLAALDAPPSPPGGLLEQARKARPLKHAD